MVQEWTARDGFVLLLDQPRDEYIMANPQMQLHTVTRPGVVMEKLEDSVASCEVLLDSMKPSIHPSAERIRYLLELKLAYIRQRLMNDKDV